METFNYKNILVLLLLGSFVSSYPQDGRLSRLLKCPQSSYCSCSEIPDVEIQCPMYEPRVVVRVQTNHYVHFECDKIMDGDLDKVPEIDVNEISMLQIVRCPLPHGKSLSTYLNKVKMSRVRTLQFMSNGVNAGRSFETKHLQNFGNVERLDIRGNEYEFKELPSDLFVNMTKLSWIRIRVSHIQLPADIFAPLENLEYLELGFNKLQTLEPGFLHNQRKLKQLNLWGNSLRNLDKDVFKGLDNVQELDLSANGMESLEPDFLTHLMNLTEINLSSNRFAMLPEGLFINNRKLRAFKLLENRVKMETLPSGMLANLTELASVIIKCDLITLPEDIFSGSENIELLKLERNELQTLPEGLIWDQKKLETLDLGKNMLTEIPEKFFITASSLKELILTNNRLINIPAYQMQNLRNLKKLHLGNNQLSEIDILAFTHLKSVEMINLENNKLTFETGSSRFQGLENLNTLNLRNNSLTTLFEDLTSRSMSNMDISHNKISMLTLTDLQYSTSNSTIFNIDLSYNQIEEINFNNKDLMISHITVNVNHNPLDCNCNILNFVKFLKSKQQMDQTSSLNVLVGDLKCAQPEAMIDLSVKSLEPLDLLCPLDNEGSQAEKRCPDDCSCMVRPEDHALLLSCNSNILLDMARFPVASAVNLNHTELRFEGTNLTELPIIQSPGYSEVTKIYASNNQLTELSPENIPPRLEVIEIDNNRLEGINHTILNLFGNSSNLKNIKLSGNPWRCDCSALKLMNFVQDRYKIIPDYGTMQCRDNGQLFKKLVTNDLCTSENIKIVYISIVVAIMSLLLGVLAALYYKYQKQIKMWLYAHNLCMWFVTEEELDKDKKYDAFVSYSHKDEDFVADFLVPELENGIIPYKLCLHERDWSPGLEISTQISNSVNDSKRTIIVMSPHYLQSNWAQWEFRVAQSHAATEKRSRIIVILYGDIGDIDKLDTDIRDYLKLNTYVKWGDKWFWHKLKYAMPHVKSLDKIQNTKGKGLVKTAIKSSVDDKLELIKPISVTPPQLTTPPAEQLANPLITSLNANKNQNGKLHNGYNGHVNGAFVINTSSRQSDV
nr:protein toll [Prodiamesa olivacea]